YNQYDESTREWHRLLDVPVLDGMGAMNAYARIPELGQDGWYHMVWMWRDTGDCATNHDISYARSRDLVTWEAGDGITLPLPITIEANPSIVDPVPAGGGLINMCKSLGFDSADRPVVSYHKHDEQGNTQAYASRLEDGVWRVYKLSDWDYRWDFSGGGSIGAEIRLGGASISEEGHLSMTWWHLKKGAGIWKLDESTLSVVGDYPLP
ncbi:MAG: BNR-4 repeat-containing protein, partial [Candidatus Latescibacterota bacterium]|nr:BNR-4 repeat-containing protein [Candidatus Latescibacterota bacterium]